jgi:branched-chain amino acid aminotransferase
MGQRSSRPGPQPPLPPLCTQLGGTLGLGHPLTAGPTLIGTQEALGVGPSSDALLFVICSPVGPYYPKGFKPVQLYATTEFVRAAPGGTGAYKLGAK